MVPSPAPASQEDAKGENAEPPGTEDVFVPIFLGIRETNGGFNGI